MAQRKSSKARPRVPRNLPGRAAKPQAAAAEPQHHLPSGAAIRETIESVVVAFILAFLFRTFEAEAFVIPTGSMAPTLMGRHKDVVCPNCGCPYRVSSSEELEEDGTAKTESDQIVAGTCPMCRYTASLAKDPSYSGDRILVGKLSYDVGEPERWDVIVFKFPGLAATNYIKRLVGLPGETVRIQDGDIWIRGPADKDKNLDKPEFAIARKPPHKILAMLQPVFDNDYMPRIAQYGWPARWYSDAAMGDGGKAPVGAWTAENYTAFRTDGASGGENWLRYHHLAPLPWEGADAGSARQPYQHLRRGELAPRVAAPELQLITDFTAYDTGRPESARNLSPEPRGTGAHWVGDLAVACTADVESPDGQLALELCKGGRRFQCRFDLATGRAILSISGPKMEGWRPTAQTGVRGAGKHDIIFSNCDDELRLWVDGRVVAFDGPTAYPDFGNKRPDRGDLAPVGVASRGAAVRISHLRVLRDIYYIAMPGDPGNPGAPGGPPENDLRFDPGRALPDEPMGPLPSQRYIEFGLESQPPEADRFFVLGDNSPMSADGRLWRPNNGCEYYVSRDLLIGKALFIYWPHSWHEIPTPWFNVPFPYFPNFGRMGLVR
jgi:signal peptidase I